MYDRKSIYALNKRDPDAIVLPDANGNLLRLTREDFSDTETFLCWKAWSDENFRAEDKSDVTESDHTVSMDGIPEAALAAPDEETLAEERQTREEQIRYARKVIVQCREKLTEKQFRRLWLYHVDGMTTAEIGEIEGVSHQNTSKSIRIAEKKIKRFSEKGQKQGAKTPEKR